MKPKTAWCSEEQAWKPYEVSDADSDDPGAWICSGCGDWITCGECGERWTSNPNRKCAHA